MVREQQRERVHDAWRAAGNALSIKIDAPYLLKTPQGAGVMCAAHLPDFGGPKGMVIGLIWPPVYKTDRELVSAAKSPDLYLSFINAEIYERYDEEVFKEALIDWGFFGGADRCPNWLQNA